MGQKARHQYTMTQLYEYSACISITWSWRTQCPSLFFELRITETAFRVGCNLCDLSAN